MRTIGKVLVLAMALSGIAAFSVAQTTQFEVASIKPVPPPFPPGGGPWIANHGRFRAEAAQVRGVIAMAYEVLPVQVKGGDYWIDREPYSFDARAENPDAGPDQIRAMVQTLLADRFKLAVRRETRQVDAYRLIVGKNGSKLKDANGGRSNYINWTGLGQVTFTEMTSLLPLSAILGSILDVPVLDETGLKGTYNYSLEFSDPRLPADLRSRPDLFTAVQEQLGLQLQQAKGPFAIIVIDHVERPSEN
jgi:uncharacterized protein (TIGR03435 family)